MRTQNKIVIYVGADEYGWFVYRMYRNTSMRKMMNYFCSKLNLRQKDFYFFYKGRRVRGTDNPQTLAMDYGDIVKVCKDDTKRRKSI